MSILSVSFLCKEIMRLTAISSKHVMNCCPLVCEYPLLSFLLSMYYLTVAMTKSDFLIYIDIRFDDD